MAKVFKSVSDALVQHRVWNQQVANGLKPEAHGLVSSTVDAALTMMREVGIRAAIEVDERSATQEQLDQVTNLFLGVIDGVEDAEKFEKVIRLSEDWPELYRALMNLCIAEVSGVRQDPLYKIVKEGGDAEG